MEFKKNSILYCCAILLKELSVGSRLEILKQLTKEAQAEKLRETTTPDPRQLHLCT